MCRPGRTPFDSLVLSPSMDELAQDRRGSAPTSRRKRLESAPMARRNFGSDFMVDALTSLNFELNR
jgi:hypothetical protein